MDTRKASASLAVALLLSGCATPRLEGLAPGERIAVEVEPDRYGRNAAIGIVNANVGTGAKTGMGTGAILGIIGAASCGPWFFLCASVFAAAGMGSGALVGTLAGAAANLPEEARAEVVERASSRDATMRAELAESVRHKLRERWTVVDGPAPTRVRVYLDRASFVVDADHYLALALRATISFDRGGRTEKRSYEYKGLPAHASVWTTNDGARIDEALRRAYGHVAEAIYLELAH